MIGHVNAGLQASATLAPARVTCCPVRSSKIAASLTSPLWVITQMKLTFAVCCAYNLLAHVQATSDPHRAEET